MRTQPRAEWQPGAQPAQLAGDPGETVPRGRHRGETRPRPKGRREARRGALPDVLRAVADGDGGGHRREAPAEVRGQPPGRGRGPRVGTLEQHGVPVQSLTAQESPGTAVPAPSRHPSPPPSAPASPPPPPPPP